MALEARIVTLTDNEDQLIAPRTDADAVLYDENNTVKTILDRFAVETYTKEEVDAAVRNAAPRNLLDNSDFRNPVNQRGSTSYTSVTGGAYTIDRWVALGVPSTVEITSDGVLLTGVDSILFFTQYLEESSIPKGKTLTFAFEDSNGNVYFGTGAIPTSLPSSRTDYVSVSGLPDAIASAKLRWRSDGKYQLFLAINSGASITIKWAALYEGEYTAETLPEYQPKGYGAELAECQRYYLRYNLEDGAIVGTGNTDGVYVRIPFYTPHPFRIKPSINYSASFSIVYGENESDLKYIDVYRYSGNFVDIIPTVDGESPSGYVPVSLRAKTDGYIDFIADL